MAKIDLKKSIRGLNFLTKIRIFGSRQKNGDQSVFDQRGAITITDKQITKRNGEVVKIRGIQDAGQESMVIRRQSGGSNIDSGRAMEAFHGWPYAAAKAIAEEISNIEFKAFRVNKDGSHEEVPDHEVIDFLEAVNDGQTGPEFKQTLSQHLDLTGNAYILLEGVKDYMSKPTAMHLLDPSRVQIQLDKATYPFKVAKYKFTVESRDFFFQPYEIIQIKLPDPSNQFRGIGTVQGIAEWIDNDNNTTEFLRQFFNNGATIGLTFETDMTSEEQLHALRDSFIEQHSGVQNAYKGLFLPKGVKKPASDIQIKDMGVTSISEASRDRILAGFRVSKTILGTAESDTNRSTAETADYVFSKRTIKPRMLLVCSYLNEFLMPRFAKDVYISFIDPVPQDKTVMIAEMAAATGGAAIMTVNEARDKFLDLPPIAGGDDLPTITAPVNPDVPEGQDEPVDDPNQEPQKAAKRIIKAPRLGYQPSRVRKGKTQFARNVETRQRMADAMKEKIAAALKATMKKGIKDMTNQEYDEAILKEKDRRTGQYAEKMRAELVKLNARQKEEVMNNLERQMKKAAGKKAFSKLFDLEGWIKITIDALTPIAKDLFGTEAIHALNLIDKPGIDVANSPEAQKAIDRAMSLMSESYNQSTVDKLQEALTDGLQQGYSAQQMGDLVSEVYQWKDETAADCVALTESNRIANDASKIAWQQSGVVKQVQWVTSGRDNVCEFCSAEDGTIIDIDQNFYDQGDTIEGDDGFSMTADYSDIGGPPMHPNCHCGIRPIVDTSISASAKPEIKADPEMMKRIDALEAKSGKTAAELDELKALRLRESKELDGIMDAEISAVESQNG